MEGRGVSLNDKFGKKSVLHFGTGRRAGLDLVEPRVRIKDEKRPKPGNETDREAPNRRGGENEYETMCSHRHLERQKLLSRIRRDERTDIESDADRTRS